MFVNRLSRILNFMTTSELEGMRHSELADLLIQVEVDWERDAKFLRLESEMGSDV